MVSRFGKVGRRWLLLGHRWLGIATALLFVLWIGSGLVMLYVPFPSLEPAQRVSRLSAIAWDRIEITPAAALAAAASSGPLRLEMLGDEPVYRISSGAGTPTTVSAATGRRLGPIHSAAALRIAGGAHAQMVRRDQWTVTARYDPLRPFWKVALDDEAGSEVYVSVPTGEIALITSRWQRAWNWAGAVTHWVYLTPLRARPDAWRQVVLYVSGLACLAALTGFVIGLWRVRLRNRYRNGAVSPYRGLALWHHGFGLIGGLTLTSFIVSGWLSMNPNRWFSSQTPPDPMRLAYAGHPGALSISLADLERLAGATTKIVRFSPIGNRWWLIRDDGDGPRAVGAGLSPGACSPLSSCFGPAEKTEEAFRDAASGAVFGGRLVSSERLIAYDAYWYPHGDPRPLPVLRLTFDDPAATWLHIDLRDGSLLNRLDRSGRINRWLFDAAHRLDFPGLMLRPTARDAAQWVLNLLAAGIALTGLIAGWRRLARKSRRA